MDMETRRVTVAGLRGADVATLRVLTQDVIQLPLNQIETSTLCDLFALSELQEGIPGDLLLELQAFRERRIRELNDIPDGDALSEFVLSLAAQAADQVPGTLRAAVTALAPDRSSSEDALVALASHLESVEPVSFIVGVAAEEAPSQAAKAAKERKPAKKKKKTSSRTVKNPERAEWIGEYAVSRLKNYETGLKEAILVGGTCHKAPWSDVTDKEVRAVLRALAREGKLRLTAGRWVIDR